MKKIISEKYYEEYPENFDIFFQWSKINEAIIKFENNCKQSTFEYLFGKENGEKLWLSFVIDCDRKFQKFRTYLTNEQFNDALVNIYYNETLLAN